MKAVATIIGNLGADPDIRSVGKTTVANMRIATRYRVKSESGDWENESMWWSAAAWGGLATYVEKSGLEKGDLIQITGEVSMRSWVNRDNETVEQLAIDATHVVALGRLEKRDGGSARAPARSSFRPARSRDTYEDDLDDDIPF